MIPSTEPFAPDSFSTTERYLTMVAGTDRDAFVDLADFTALADGAGVERDSQLWAGQLFRHDANPYGPSRARRSYCRAEGDRFDLLRHELRVGDLALEITESVRFVLVRVLRALPVELGDDARAAAAIESIAADILQTRGRFDDPFGQPHEYRWTLLYEPPIRDGSRFTTAPTKEPDVLRSHAERLDAGLHEGDPFFVAFKARPSGDGRLVFLDGRRWFDGSCWAPYAESPRRAR